MFRFWVIICIASACLAACTGSGKRDIKAYYFPADDLRKGLVYEYEVTQNGISTPEYWYYRSFQRDSGTFLTSTYYDQFFQIGQISREKIVESGAQAQEYFLYETDSLTGGQNQTRANITAPVIFPFRVKDSTGVFLFSVNFQPGDDSLTTVYVIRNRRFLGDAPEYEVLGKKLPCVRFRLHEAIGNKKDGVAEVEGVGEEWYAKGIGLVWYRKTYGSGALQINGRLLNIFPMAELEQKAAEFFGEE